jgi:hypothetical protein
MKAWISAITLMLLGSGPHAVMANPDYLSVKYYTDFNCNDYNIAFSPSLDGECYEYEYSGTHSAKLVQWPTPPNGKSWACTYFTDSGCKGAKNYSPASEKKFWNQCANSLGQFKSVLCYED